MEQLGITVRRGRIENGQKLETTVDYFLSVGRRNSKSKPGTIGFVTNPKISASLRKVIAGPDFLRRHILDQGRELGWISATSNPKERTIKIQRRHSKIFNDLQMNFQKAGVKFILEKEVLGDLGKLFKGYKIARPKANIPVPLPRRTGKAKTSISKFPRPRRARK